MSNNELYHYGVPGMKWGKRKPSSEPTQTNRPAKKKADDQKKNNKPTTNNQQQNNNQPKKPAIDINKIRNKKLSDMTNDELRALNERQQLEETHRRFNPSKIAKGLAIAGAVAAALGTVVAIYRNSKEIMKAGKEIMDARKTKTVENVVNNAQKTKSVANNVVKATPKKEVTKPSLMKTFKVRPVGTSTTIPAKSSVPSINYKSIKSTTKSINESRKNMTKAMNTKSNLRYTPIKLKTSNVTKSLFTNGKSKSNNTVTTTKPHTKVGMTAIQSFIKKHPSTGVSTLNKSTVNSGQSLVQGFLKKYPKRTLTSV